MPVDILNVFTPAAVIEDADRFAGRLDQLDALNIALQSKGVQIVIYGNRGVGKSSLGRQLTGMARGDQGVLDRLTTPPHETPDYMPIFFECDDTITDVRALILRLLTDDAALAPWVPYRVEKKTTTGEGNAGLDVKLVKVGGKISGTTTITPEIVEADIYSVFANAINHILDSGVVKHGLVIVLDEFDRIGNRQEIASILRSRGADPRVKFALVGVATTPQELIQVHESVSRQISDGCIHMPPMSDLEQRQIFTKAHEVLQGEGISFSEEAQTWIIQVAKGHPYYVHLLGKHSLIRCVASKQKVVTEQLAREALDEIALKGSAPVQETTYKKAIGHSFIREYVLKQFASVETEEINTTALYSKIAQDLRNDASAISVYVGQLSGTQYGPVLEKTRERYYRFKDSLFKAYAAARPFVFTRSQAEPAEDA